MPFKSAKQRRYLYSQKPEVAKKFAMDSAKKGKLAKLKVGGRTDAGPNRTTASHATRGQINEKGQTVGGGQTTRDNNPTTKTTTTKTTTTTQDPERKFYKGPPQLPTIGPGTWVANKILGWAAPKVYDAKKKRKEKFAKKEGLYRDFYRTETKPLEVMDPKNKSYMKDAGYGKTKTTNDGGGDGPKLCPDGRPPPCPPTATKANVKVKPKVKTKYAFDDFKAYKKGKMISTQSKVNGVITGLKKASKLHAGQAKTLSKLKLNKGGGVPYGPPPLRGPNPQVPPVKFSRGGGAAIRGLKFTGVK